MWQQEFTWFFAHFQREFRQSNPIAFEVIMVLALAHLFGFYNPKQLGAVLAKSDATRSRAGLSLSIDNSVIDRLGKLLRCTWSWYSGRCKHVVQGQDLLGIVLTINQVALPVHLLFCSKQGRGHTDKPSQLIAMLAQLKDEFERYDIDITQIPLTLDSWFVSEPLRQQLYAPRMRR